MEKVQFYFSLAEVEGGKIFCGGIVANLGSIYENGYYLWLVVIEGLFIDCCINQEEIFGLVVSIVLFDIEVEVLEFVNGILYGFFVILWIQDVSWVYCMVEYLQVGIVWVNCWMLCDLCILFGGMK